MSCCGAAGFAAAYLGFAFVGASTSSCSRVLFAAAGAGVGMGETALCAAVAPLAPNDLRGSAFGLVAAVQAFANMAASALAGVLWTLISPEAAFLYLAAGASSRWRASSGAAEFGPAFGQPGPPVDFGAS